MAVSTVGGAGAANIRGHLTPVARLNKTVDDDSMTQHRFFPWLRCFHPVWAISGRYHQIFLILLAVRLLASLFLSGMRIITTPLLLPLRSFLPSVSFLRVPADSKTHLSSLKLDGSSEDREEMRRSRAPPSRSG